MEKDRAVGTHQRVTVGLVFVTGGLAATRRTELRSNEPRNVRIISKDELEKRKKGMLYSCGVRMNECRIIKMNEKNEGP